MAQALGHVRLLADRIEELRDSAVKARSLVSLGDATCKFHKGYAERIFLRADEYARAAAREEEDRNKNLPQRPRVSVSGSVRSELLTAVARCDSQLALRIREAKPEKESLGEYESATDLNVAFRLLRENKDDAVQFASHAIEGNPSNQTLQQFSMFLQQLRLQDLAAADQLFLAALGGLRAQMKPDSYQLMALGNYLFSSMDVARIPAAANSITFVIVGGVSVISLQFNRPGNSPQVVRTYLEASLDMLSRPSTDARAQQFDYAAAYQLLPKARESAPDLAPAFDLAMRRLDSAVPESMKQSSQNSELSRLSQPFVRSDEEYESELANNTDPEKRQILSYRLTTSALDKADFARARKYARDLDNKDFRARLLTLIDYVEAEKAIEDGRLDAALEQGKNLPAGVERALLQTVLAAAYHSKGDTKTANSLLDTAQREAENVSAELRPMLLASIASVLARTDRDAAIELLTRVVAAYNGREKTEKPDDSVRVLSRLPGAQSGASGAEALTQANSTGFFMTLRIASAMRTVPLKAKGIEAFDLNARLLRLFSADADRAEAILSQLQDEARLGPALAALAAAYLDAAESKPVKTPEKQ